jgi:hypothetical protein
VSAPVVKEQAAAASPSASIKKDAFDYVATKLGIWTKEDAEVELGQPIDRRDGIANNAVFGDIYKYNSPAPNFASIELTISRTTKKLSAAYFYYTGIVSWKSVEEKLGKNFKKQKMANGRPIYMYQFQNRTISVLVDSGNNVYNIGVW